MQPGFHHGLPEASSTSPPTRSRWSSRAGPRPLLPPIEEAWNGLVGERQAAQIAGLIQKLNDLFHGELTDQDKLVYVNDVLMGKLLESNTLRQQAANNSKQQFATSPDLNTELVNAIISALDAHTAMSTQALNSPDVQRGLKDILLNHSELYERLRQSAEPAPGPDNPRVS